MIGKFGGTSYTLARQYGYYVLRNRAFNYVKAYWERQEKVLWALLNQLCVHRIVISEQKPWYHCTILEF